MRILLYTRPNSEEFLRNLAREVSSDCELFEISDFKGHGDIWSGNFLNGKQDMILFDDAIHENIRLRCRLLRSLQVETAYRLIDKYSFFVHTVFEKFKPDLVLSQLPDNYCMDIIQRVALMKGIVCASMIDEFISGYSRLSLRGERIKIRESSAEEAENIIKQLTDKDYKSVYATDVGNTYHKHIKYIIRRKLIESFYYPLKKKMEGDPWNYHYNTTYYKGTHISEIVNKSIENIFVHIKDIQVDTNCIYVPLHCYPEATVDYYGDDPKYALYEDFMLDVVKNTDQSIRLLIKEHPAMYGARKISFYKKLNEMDNVVLLHPYDNSNEVLKKCKYVLVFSGSVGVEAVIRKKVLFTLTSNYYSDLSPNIHPVSRLSSELLDIEYNPFDNVIFMRNLLDGLMDCRLGDQAHLQQSDIKEMGIYVRKYYESMPLQKLN